MKSLASVISSHTHTRARVIWQLFLLLSLSTSHRNQSKLECSEAFVVPCCLFQLEAFPRDSALNIFFSFSFIFTRGAVALCRRDETSMWGLTELGQDSSRIPLVCEDV